MGFPKNRKLQKSNSCVSNSPQLRIGPGIRWTPMRSWVGMSFQSIELYSRAFGLLWSHAIPFLKFVQPRLLICSVSFLPRSIFVYWANTMSCDFIARIKFPCNAIRHVHAFPNSFNIFLSTQARRNISIFIHIFMHSFTHSCIHVVPITNFMHSINLLSLQSF